MNINVRAGSNPALGTKLRNSQIDSYIELLVRIQHLPYWQIGEIGLRDRLVIYFHFYLFVGILFLDFNFRSIAQLVQSATLTKLMS